MTRRGPAEAGRRVPIGATARHAAPRTGAARRTPAATDAGPRHRRPSSSALGANQSLRRSTLGRRAAIVSATVVGLGLVAGPALAYFSAGGIGAASAGTTTLQPVTVSSAVPSSSLLPGTTADLSLTVYNPNSTAVTITGVSQAGPVSVTGGSGCSGDPGWPGPLGNSGVTVPTASLNIAVAAGATVTVHVPAGASMSTASATGCQGASFQIPVAVVVRQ
jgi:hypothetical protein